jgi:hypothetical protein
VADRARAAAGRGRDHDSSGRTAAAAPARGHAAQGRGRAEASLAERRRRYGSKALERIANELLGTPRGGRNEALFRAACQTHRLANGGCLGSDDAERELWRVACACGLNSDEIRATIHSGIAHAGNESSGPKFDTIGAAVAAAILGEVQARRRAFYEQRKGWRRRA